MAVHPITLVWELGDDLGESRGGEPGESSVELCSKRDNSAPLLDAAMLGSVLLVVRLRQRKVIRWGAQESMAIIRDTTRGIAVYVDTHKPVRVSSGQSDDHLDDIQLRDSRHEYFQFLDTQISAQAAQAILLRRHNAPVHMCPDAGTCPNPSCAGPAKTSTHPIRSRP